MKFKIYGNRIYNSSPDGPCGFLRGLDIDLLSLYLIDLNGLTRPERWRLAYYAMIIFAPLVAAFLAWWWYGPGY